MVNRVVAKKIKARSILMVNIQGAVISSAVLGTVWGVIAFSEIIPRLINPGVIGLIASPIIGAFTGFVLGSINGTLILCGLTLRGLFKNTLYIDVVQGRFAPIVYVAKKKRKVKGAELEGIKIDKPLKKSIESIVDKQAIIDRQLAVEKEKILLDTSRHGATRKKEERSVVVQIKEKDVMGLLLS